VPEQNKKKQHGQSTIEYMITAGLVALSIVFVWRNLGQTVREQSAQMAVQISGGGSAGAHIEAVGPGNGKHCCGVRGNPPTLSEKPDRSTRAES
jgi:hypothetical protein